MQPPHSRINRSLPSAPLMPNAGIILLLNGSIILVLMTLHHELKIVDNVMHNKAAVFLRLDNSLLQDLSTLSVIDKMEITEYIEQALFNHVQRRKKLVTDLKEIGYYVRTNTKYIK